MTMGRPRKPTQQKILEGGRIREDKGDQLGPQVAIELPPCPAWLGKNAKKHWQVLGAQLVAVGLISVVDGDVFALHCDNLEKYEQVQAELKNIKDWIDTTPNGFVVQSAYFNIRNRLQEQVIKTAREFGMTPSARSSIKPTLPQQGGLFADNDFAAYS